MYGGDPSDWPCSSSLMISVSLRFNGVTLERAPFCWEMEISPRCLPTELVIEELVVEQLEVPLVEMEVEHSFDSMIPFITTSSSAISGVDA